MKHRPQAVATPRVVRALAPIGELPAEAPAGPNILVVEDDAGERRSIQRALAPWKDSVRYATSVADAVTAVALGDPDIILLDLGLPDGDGIEVLRRVRRTSVAIIVVHSARSEELEKVALLDSGADDYVTKPVGAEELRARVRAHLRRIESERLGVGTSMVVAGDLRINVARHRVTRAGVEVKLTPTEWSLLRALMLHAGRTLAHRALWEQVWGREFGDASLHLRVQITHLRRKIERNAATPSLIITEPGVGYRFELP